MSQISLVGLASNDPVPGSYLEINFAQGEASRGTSVYTAILVGNKLSTGSATSDTVVYGPDTAVSLTSEADAISLFGAGSELHRKYRRFVKVNSTTPLYAIAVSEGTTPVAATGTVTIATTATGSATIRLYVGDEFVDAGIATGDTPTVIAAALIKAANGKTHWPVVASAAAGVITLTSKQKGLRANFIRYWAQIKPSGVGTTVTPTASTFTSGGSVSDDSTTALATLALKRYYYIVSAAEDATQLGALVSQVNTQQLAVTGIRQRVVAGSIDTLANTITITTALNAARAEIVWLAGSDVPPCEMAANNAAIYALEEASLVPRLNFSGYGSDAKTQANWKINAPLNGAAPTRSQLFAALNAGITPIGINSSGSSYLVKRVTTRFLSGSVPDYRIRDSHKVTVCDKFGDDLQVKFSLQMSGKQIGDDPVKNEPTPGANVATLKIVKALINRLVRDYGDDALLQRVGEIIAATQVVRETSPATRMSAQVQLQPTDILDQIATQVNQVA